MKISCPALVASLGLFATLLPAEEGWTYLFEGSELDDFYFDFIEETDPASVFEIKQDGTLIINGKDQPEGYIQTLDDYENYEIMFEYRWPDEPGKSGIQIHATSDTAHGIWPVSIEIQLEPEKSGDFWVLNTSIEVTDEQMPKKAAERNRRIRLDPDKELSSFERSIAKPLEKEPEQWNEMHIVARGDTIKVYLNGRLVNEARELSAKSGFITIQSEESNLEIRGFRIRDLDTSA